MASMEGRDGNTSQPTTSAFRSYLPLFVEGVSYTGGFHTSDMNECELEALHANNIEQSSNDNHALVQEQEVQRLKRELEEKDRIIEELKAAAAQQGKEISSSKKPC